MFESDPARPAMQQGAGVARQILGKLHERVPFARLRPATGGTRRAGCCALGSHRDPGRGCATADEEAGLEANRRQPPHRKTMQ
jgi:hypothetical protein